MLYKWKEQLGSKGDEAFLKQAGRPLKEEQSEVLTLKQENRRLREEVEILKKAAVYFAKELKWRMRLSVSNGQNIDWAFFVHHLVYPQADTMIGLNAR